MRVLTALTQKAQRWVDENVYCEDWQRVYGGIAGDWRMVNDIREAMLEEGFRDTKRWWQFWFKVDFVS